MLTLNSQQGNCCNRLKTLEPIARDFRTGMTPMDLSPYLLFDIAHSHYAINAKVVEEVFFLPELTTMAEAPRDIVGMFNLRGNYCSGVRFASLPRPSPPTLSVE